MIIYTFYPAARRDNRSRRLTLVDPVHDIAIDAAMLLYGENK